MERSCIIIEDQPPAQRILQKFITDIGILELKGTFANALDAISLLQNEQVDIIFLDIHLPKISGIDFLKTLKNSPQIILTTAFSEYALESYEYNVVDYLLKPFSFQRFVQAVTKCNSLLGSARSDTSEHLTSKNPFFLIKSGYDHIKVFSSDILYIKADGDYTEVVTNERTLLSTDSLKNWLDRLHEYDFTQIHKSYILNVLFIKKISSTKVELSNHISLPIGRVYKSRFMEKFLDNQG